MALLVAVNALPDDPVALSIGNAAGTLSAIGGVRGDAEDIPATASAASGIISSVCIRRCSFTERNGSCEGGTETTLIGRAAGLIGRAEDLIG